MSVSFYYLRGAFYGDPELREQHEKRIEALLNGEIGQDQIEVLQEGVCSLRLTEKERLLYTIEEVNGESYLSVLEYLPNHEYSQSRFLQSGALKKYQKKNETLYAQLVAQTQAEQEQAKQKMLDDLKKTYKKMGSEGRPQVLEFYQNELLVLTSLQKDALALRLPAVLSGVAGSGKSVIALTAIADYVDTHSPQQGALYKAPRRRILYISKSEALVQQNKRFWKDLPASKNPHHTVDFISLEFLIEEGLKKGLTLGKEDFFNSFCQDYFSYHNKLHHDYSIKMDFKKIREEFLICSGYDKAGYLGLGVKQSTVGKEVREIYYSAYQAYLAHLKRTNTLDPDFYALELDNYDLIIMDEAQDLSYHAINSIHAKANNASIMYCMDSHQRLGSSKSVRPYLLDKIGNDPKRHVTLVSTHRCPVKVVNAANEVLTFKQLMVDGLADKYETPNIQSIAAEKGLGSVYVCDEQSLLSLPWMTQAKQAYFVVITSKKNCEDPKTLEAIKKRFNTTQVLSPEQAKGLEYDVVLAYDLYDEEVFKSLKEKIQTLDEESKPSSHQPKFSTGHEECSSFFNEVYTSYTRAKTALIVCEKETHLNKPLVNKIKKGADAGLPPEDLFSKLSTKNDWELEVTKQLEAGNDNLAKNTYLNHLVIDKGNQEKEYDAFVRALHAKANPPVKPKLEERKKHLAGTFPEEKKESSLNGVTSGKKSPNLQFLKSSSPSEVKLAAENPLVIHTPIKAPSQDLVRLMEERLFKDFNETNFMNLMRLPKDQIKPLNEITYTQADKGTISLLTFIGEDENRGKSFFKWVANSLFILVKMNLALPPIQNPSFFIMYLSNLQPIQNFLQLSDLEHSQFKELIPKSPAQELLRVYKKSAQKKHLNGYISYLTTLIAMGADINNQLEKDDEFENENNKFIHLAASLGDIKVLQLLHERRINLSEPKENGMTVAHIAARKGHVEVLKVLSTLGIDLDEVDKQAYTPLVWAVLKGHYDVVSYLIEKNEPSNTSFYLNCEKAHSLFQKKSGYALHLIEQISYLVQTQGLRASIKEYSEIPINLAQLALALGDKKTALLLKEPILEHYSYEKESKTAEPDWTHCFSITEPNIDIAPINPTLAGQLNQIILNRLLNEQTFNEAALQALIDHSEYRGKSLDSIIIKYKGEEQSLLDYIRGHTKIAQLFFKCLVNNSYLLNNTLFNNPSSLTSSFDRQLVALQSVKKMISSSIALSKNEVPIHCAVQQYSFTSDHTGFWDLLDFLFQAGANLTIPNQEGQQLVHWAIINYRLGILLFLAKKKTNLGAPLEGGRTIAHMAAEKNNITAIFKILKDNNFIPLLFQPDNQGITPAHILAEHGFVDAFKELSEFNYDLKLDAPDSISQTRPSHIAAEKGHFEILDILNQLKINLDQSTSSGETPLSLAIKNGQIKLLSLLMQDNQARRRHLVSWDDINNYITKSPESTPYLSRLHQFEKDNPQKSWLKQSGIFIPLEELAAIYGQIKIRDFFIQQKSVPSCFQNDCLSLYVGNLNLNSQLSSAWLAAYMNDWELLECLNANGVDLSGLDEEGYGLAHFAAQNDNLEVLKWIYSKPNLNHLLGKKSNSGITPAYILAERGYALTLKKLNERGLDLNVACALGIKPVHIAALNGHTQALEVFQSLELLEEPTQYKGANGINPLMLAALAGQMSTVKFLVENGVEVDKKCSIALADIPCFFKNADPSFIDNINEMLESTPLAPLEKDYPMSFNALTMAMSIKHDDITNFLKSKLFPDDPSKKESPDNKPVPLGRNSQSIFHPEKKAQKKKKTASHPPKPQFFNNAQSP